MESFLSQISGQQEAADQMPSKNQSHSPGEFSCRHRLGIEPQPLYQSFAQKPRLCFSFPRFFFHLGFKTIMHLRAV